MQILLAFKSIFFKLNGKTMAYRTKYRSPQSAVQVYCLSSRSMVTQPIKLHKSILVTQPIQLCVRLFEYCPSFWPVKIEITFVFLSLFGSGQPWRLLTRCQHFGQFTKKSVGLHHCKTWVHTNVIQHNLSWQKITNNKK